jgi:hypothetical protein
MPSSTCGSDASIRVLPLHDGNRAQRSKLVRPVAGWGRHETSHQNKVVLSMTRKNYMNMIRTTASTCGKRGRPSQERYTGPAGSISSAWLCRSKPGTGPDHQVGRLPEFRFRPVPGAAAPQPGTIGLANRMRHGAGHGGTLGATGGSGPADRTMPGLGRNAMAIGLRPVARSDKRAPGRAMRAILNGRPP